MSEFKGTKGKWIVDNEEFCLNESGALVTPISIENFMIGLMRLYGDQHEAKANALLISKAPCFYEELKETIIDLKILRNQIALESKNVYRWQGMPELIDEWINRKEQLIKEATEI